MAEFLQATVRLPFVTGLPRDVAENTFNFACFPGLENIDILQAGIEEFFNEDLDDPVSAKIAQRMSGSIVREACQVIWRGVEATTGEQTTPTVIRDWEMVAGSGGGDLPLEVAVCVSYGTNTPVTTSPRRRRGRIYIGPLKAVALSTDTGLPKPAPAFVNTLTRAAARLARVEPSVGLGWSVWSRADGELYPIQGGFVDNEFDTQRRRGVEATARDVWNTETP